MPPPQQRTPAPPGLVVRLRTQGLPAARLHCHIYSKSVVTPLLCCHPVMHLACSSVVASSPAPVFVRTPQRTQKGEQRPASFAPALGVLRPPPAAATGASLRLGRFSTCVYVCMCGSGNGEEHGCVFLARGGRKQGIIKDQATCPSLKPSQLPPQLREWVLAACLRDP